jgi:hypothetical protein
VKITGYDKVILAFKPDRSRLIMTICKLFLSYKIFTTTGTDLNFSNTVANFHMVALLVEWAYGGTVVEALRYEPEGHGIDSQ